MFRRFLTKGSKVRSPYGDKNRVELMIVTGVGVAFKHPKLGYCGCRFEAMDEKAKKYILARKWLPEFNSTFDHRSGWYRHPDTRGQQRRMMAE